MLNVYRRTNEALALKPDLLILVVMPTDVRRDLSKEQLAHRDDPPGSEADQRRPVQGEGFLKRVIVTPIKESRSVYMLQHFMYQDPQTYMRLYLNYGDSGEFYKVSPSSTTQKRLADFNVLLGGIVQKAQAASVPMLILIGPAAAAVAIENSEPNSQFNVDAFTEKIRAIASNYQIPVIDPTPQFKGVSNSMSLFYIVDGHLNASGQALVAQALDQELLSGKYPIFAGCQAR